METSQDNDDRRCRKTKKAIKNALVTLAAEKDISHITVTEISQAADINRKTFYAHYASPYEVLDDIESDLIEDLNGVVINTEFSSTRFNPTPIFENLTRLIMQDPQFYSYLFEATSYGNLMGKVGAVLKDELFELMKAEYDIPESILRIIVEYTSGGICSIYQYWLQGDRSMPLTDITCVAIAAAFDGISAVVSAYQGGKPIPDLPDLPPLPAPPEQDNSIA